MNNELNFLIYNTPEENISINAVVKEETIWLTQKAMSEVRCWSSCIFFSMN